MNIKERDSQNNIQRLAPVIRNAYNLGRVNRNDEAFALLEPYLADNAVPAFFCPTAGWVIYRYMKAHLSQLLPLQASAMFDYYLQICPHKPDVMHSCMMVLAVSYRKLHTQEYSFAAFCRSWGLSNFRNEDYIPSTTTDSFGNSVVYQPLVERVATCLYKELKQFHTSELATEFLPFFKDVYARCPDYKFIPLYIANLYAWYGAKDLAVQQFKSLLAKNQQWFLWMHLGALLDNKLKISCYCKTLTMTDKEDYIGEVHLSLALLLHESNPSQAAYELDMYMSTYKRNGWRLKNVSLDLERALSGTTPAAEGKRFYEANSMDAEEFVYHDMPIDKFAYTGVFTNSKGKTRASLKNRSKHLTINTPIIPILQKANVGDVFMCRYRIENKRPLLLTAHPTGDRVVVKEINSKGQQRSGKGEPMEVEGKVRIRDGQPFAFVENFFIPPHLRQSANLVNGQFVKAKAMQQPDGRWRIVKIISKV